MGFCSNEFESQNKYDEKIYFTSELIRWLGWF